MVTATTAARLAAAVALVGGLTVVALPLAHAHHFTEDPDARTEVTSTVVDSQFGGSTTRRVVMGPSGTSTTDVIESPAPRTKLTTTTEQEKRSLLERAFGAGGFFVFRVALVFLGAYLAGALVQRAFLGKFGIETPFLKVGDLPEAAAASKRAFSDLRNSVKRVKKQLDATTHELERTVADTTSATVSGFEALQAQLHDLLRRVDRIENPAPEPEPDAPGG